MACKAVPHWIHKRDCTKKFPRSGNEVCQANNITIRPASYVQKPIGDLVAFAFHNRENSVVWNTGITPSNFSIEMTCSIQV